MSIVEIHKEEHFKSLVSRLGIMIKHLCFKVTVSVKEGEIVFLRGHTK